MARKPLGPIAWSVMDLTAKTPGYLLRTRCRRQSPHSNLPSVQSYSDGQLHWIIQNGVSPSGMPASKDVFRDEEIWQLVLYIRHLPQKGSLGEPAVWGGEGSAPTNKVR